MREWAGNRKAYCGPADLSNTRPAGRTGCRRMSGAAPGGRIMTPSTAPATRSSSLPPLAALLLAMASTPAGASLAKSLFPAVGAAGTAALRLAFSAVILTLILRPWRLRLDRAGWRAVVSYGLSLGLMNLLFYLSLDRIPLGIAVALEFTGPLAVAVAASRRPVDFLWVVLAAAGLWLLLPTAGAAEPLDPLGVACALGAGACWAAYIVFGRRASLKGGMPTVALASLIAAAAVLPIGLAQAGAALIAPSLLPYALGVALLSSALPYAIEVWVLARMPARVFGTLLSVEPAFAALSGLLFLGEALSLPQWLGVAAVAAASAGVTATRARG